MIPIAAKPRQNEQQEVADQAVRPEPGQVDFLPGAAGAAWRGGCCCCDNHGYFFNSQSFNFPFQGDTGFLFYFLNNHFSQCFNVFGGGRAGIDQKVAMLFGNFGAADPEIGTTRLLYQFPCAQAFGIFKSGTGRFLIIRLVCFTIILCCSRIRLISSAEEASVLKSDRKDNPIVGKQAVAIR